MSFLSIWADKLFMEGGAVILEAHGESQVTAEISLHFAAFKNA